MLLVTAEQLTSQTKGIRAACKNNGGERWASNSYSQPIQNPGLRRIFSTKSAGSHELLTLFLATAHANAALKQRPERDERR